MRGEINKYPASVASQRVCGVKSDASNTILVNIGNKNRDTVLLEAKNILLKRGYKEKKRAPQSPPYDWIYYYEDQRGFTIVKCYLDTSDKGEIGALFETATPMEIRIISIIIGLILFGAFSWIGFILFLVISGYIGFQNQRNQENEMNGLKVEFEKLV